MRSVLIAAAALVVLTGCGGGEGTGSASQSTSPSASTSAAASPTPSAVASGWPELDGDLPVPADTSALTAPPQFGPSASALAKGTLTVGDAGPSTEVDADPCKLVLPTEWTRWVQSAGQIDPLEEGDACGYRNVDDTVRMAVAVLPYAKGSPGRFLPKEVTGTAQTLRSTVAVTRARWVERYPVEQSSVLVVETASYDLVLEMSSRSALTSDDLRLGAIGFAESALGRIG
jgi:hypothetical protein